jgi:hypothetical protein
MILLSTVAGIAVGAGYALGGRLSRLEELAMRWWALAPVGLALQFAVLPRELDPSGLSGWILLVVSYVVLLGFAGANVHLPGFPLLFLGLALNLAVIAPNGGMPVSPDALRGADPARAAALEQGEGKHHVMSNNEFLSPLGDVIPVGGAFREILSVGDLFMYSGMALTIVWAMRAPTATAAPAFSGSRRGYRGKHRPYRSLPRSVRALAPHPAAATSET